MLNVANVLYVCLRPTSGVFRIVGLGEDDGGLELSQRVGSASKFEQCLALPTLANPRMNV